MLKIVTVTGPSCAGKTTLVRALLKTGHFCEVVSFTSRAPRAGEVEGIDYYFKSEEDCREIIHTGKAAEFISFKGNFYGIERIEIEEKFSLGKIPLVIVEPRGLEQIQKIYSKEVYSVYVDAPLKLLFERFLGRFQVECSSPHVDLKYHASRIVGIRDEHKDWNIMCERDFYISSFTYDNKNDILNSLLEVLMEKNKSDQS